MSVEVAVELLPVKVAVPKSVPAAIAAPVPSLMLLPAYKYTVPTSDDDAVAVVIERPSF